MGIFEQFPYTNIHNLNLDWILRDVKSFAETLAEFRTDFDEGMASIPEVVQTTGTSTAAVMSQKAVTDAINALILIIGTLENMIPGVVQTTGTSETAVMSQKAVTDAIPAVEQTTGSSTTKVMSQKAVTDAIPAIEQTTGSSTTKVMSQKAVTDAIPAIEQTTGSSTTKVMSQKAVTDAIAANAGVSSIENYHQAGTALTADITNQEQIYGPTGALSHLTDGGSTLYLNPTPGLYRITTVLPYANNVEYAAAWPHSSPDIEGATVVFTASNAGPDPLVYTAIVNIPAGIGCLTVNNYDTVEASTSVEYIADAGAWEWDGLPDGCVTTGKIAGNAVTGSKIASGAVTEGKIASSSITSAKFDAAARAPGVAVVTTAPTADNNDGLKFVVLSAEPGTFYDGWVYLIEEATP